MDYIDLHIHTDCSDGKFRPEKVVKLAAEKQLKAIAITDHDTIAGLAGARKAAGRSGVQMISGVELSVVYRNIEIHVLGYLFDEHHTELVEYLDDFFHWREQRAKNILKKLSRLGVSLPFEAIKARVNGGVICRPHIAHALMEEGYVFSYQEAFTKYLGEDKPGFISKKSLSPTDAIIMIHRAGGLAFLAHPGIGKCPQILSDLVRMDFDGIEVYHPNHLPEDVITLKRLADNHQLLVSGGSDCHGTRTDHLALGSMNVPVSVLAAMQKSHNSRKT